MEWSDDGVVISVRAHGETGAIVEALTRDHGRHLGLVRGGASRKVKPALQPGNRLHLHWRARLAEHLGNFSAEIARSRAGDLFDSRDALLGFNAFAGVVSAAMPEREPHAPVYEAGEILLDAIVADDFAHWSPLYVRWETGLLDALGFGLDLSQCVATGTRDDLVYVSPKSGRAVSAAAGEAYASRLFPLPQFLLGSQNAAPTDADVLAGLRLTGHFLAERVLIPHRREMPAARTRLEERAARESK